MTPPRPQRCPYAPRRNPWRISELKWVPLPRTNRQARGHGTYRHGPPDAHLRVRLFQVGHQFEQFQSMRDEPLKRCPKCKKLSLKRLIGGGAGLIFRAAVTSPTTRTRACPRPQPPSPRRLRQRPRRAPQRPLRPPLPPPRNKASSHDLKEKKATKGPSWMEVGLGALLSVILGVVLGAAYMVEAPVQNVNRYPRTRPQTRSTTSRGAAISTRRS